MNKLVNSIREVIELSGLKDGMTVSFHHHLRNGDFVLNMVMDEIAKSGVKDLTVNASSLFDTHMPLIDHIKKGVVTCAIGQDPFRLGHDPVIYLYNYIVKRQTPPSDYMWTRIDVVDIDNVDNLLS